MTTRKRGNGSIYQQPGCLTWTISYYGYNGRRIREATGTEDYRAAQQKLREKLVAIGRGEQVEPRRRREVLMSELYDGLARHYRVNGRKSLDAVERRWLLHLKPVFGEMPARNLTHDLLNKYIDQRQAEKAASATINRELAALKTMLRLGLRDHRLTVPLFPPSGGGQCSHRLYRAIPGSTSCANSRRNCGSACSSKWPSPMAGARNNFDTAGSTGGCSDEFHSFGCRDH
jgi:hypothetical protein